MRQQLQLTICTNTKVDVTHVRLKGQHTPTQASFMSSYIARQSAAGMSEHIEVAVRLRPLSDNERETRDSVVVFPEDDRSLAVQDFNGTFCRSSYDMVLGPSASNTDVFGKVMRDMLAESMLGKNATIFAYGQTGSGKTHTIEGLMALSAHYLFDAIADTPDREFLVKLSAMEVYNEAVHDLLRRDTGRMELSETKTGKLIVKNLREEPLPSSAELQRLLKVVRDNRKVRFRKPAASCDGKGHSRSGPRLAKHFLVIFGASRSCQP
jgi:centromeric protein E